jgi:diguanylate cyclase (GGDEF)-like protein
MRYPRPRSAAEPRSSASKRSASLNSVSTRIILCVFASTLLTAVIVSWLGIGAVHRDVRSRIAQQEGAILADRADHLARWHADSVRALAGAVAVGSPWHPTLTAALDALEARGEDATLLWQTRSPLERDDRDPSGPLPPPAELAARFERLTLYDDDVWTAPPAEDGCLRVGEDVRRGDGARIGRLEGCLSHDAVYEALLPTTRVLQGLRILVADARGRIVAGAGVRAESRLGQRLPLDDLLHPPDDELSTYHDEGGTELVGRLRTVGRSGWLLVAETRYAVAFAPAIAVARQIVAVGVCILLLFSILAYKITQAIMQPIHALSEGARRIAEGHMNYEIPMPANDDDELGLLVLTFNGMMRKLRQSRIEIERDHMRLAEKNEELQHANEVLAQLSITDGLTKLHNHRYFQDHLTREIKRVSRTGAPLAMILLDIDDFKQLNDTHGHAAGDEVLVSLAAIMNDSARESDLIARYGGEEFVILLPNTDLAGAVHLAEKVRMAVESTRLIIGSSFRPTNVTVSVGVALYRGNRREFFAEADKALYAAKAAGKNCVIIAGAEGKRLA